MDEKSPHDGILQEPSQKHPSDYALIKLMRGEFNREDARRLQQHTQACTHCLQRLREMDAKRRSFLEEHPVAESVGMLPASPSLLDRLKRLFEPLAARPALVAVAAMCIVVVIVGVLLLQGPEQPTDSEPAEVLRPKGEGIHWVVQRGGRQLTAHQGFAFRGGDAIGFSLLASSPLYVRIVSVNEQGRVAPLIPAPDEAPLRLKATERHDLPASLVLEPPVAPERVFVILSQTPVALEVLTKTIEAALAELRAGGKGLRELTTLPLDAHVESRLIDVR